MPIKSTKYPRYKADHNDWVWYLGEGWSLLAGGSGRGFVEETALSWALNSDSQPLHHVAHTESGISWLAPWDTWIILPLDGSTGQEGFQWPRPHLAALRAKGNELFATHQLGSPALKKEQLQQVSWEKECCKFRGTGRRGLSVWCILTTC